MLHHDFLPARSTEYARVAGARNLLAGWKGGAGESAERRGENAASKGGNTG